jgi:hypothetical protein
VVHVTDQGKPFALDYFVSPIPHDGTCPNRTKTDPLNLPVFTNTTISVRSPKFPPLYATLYFCLPLDLNALQRPALRAPPPLMPEGALVQPEPEKTFVQKYWMILIAVLFFLRKSLSIFK